MITLSCAVFRIYIQHCFWATLVVSYSVVTVQTNSCKVSTKPFPMKSNILYFTRNTKYFNCSVSYRYFGLFEFRRPLFFIRDPEMIKQLAIKDFDSFVDHRMVLDDSVDNIFGKSLIALRGEKWRHMRATLSPSFTGSKMRQMFELITDCADTMTNALRSKIVNDGLELHVEMKELFSKYTMDVIASTAFGIKVNSFENENNEFLTNGKKLMNQTGIFQAIKLTLTFLVPRLMKFLKIEILDKNVMNFFEKMVTETMDVRQANNIIRPDMIHMLMQSRKSSLDMQSPISNNVASTDNNVSSCAEVSDTQEVGVKKELSDKDIIAQCFLFFAAGFDTTASALSFIAHELAVNPDVQEKLFNECFQTNQELNGKPIKYDMLQKLKYLDQVVAEGLRMWPPAIFTDRMCNHDYEYKDENRKLLITKGTQIWIPIYGMHHDEKYFPNPDRFIPERFSDEEKDNIVPGTYIPFGVGPRNCIGEIYFKFVKEIRKLKLFFIAASRFALMEVKSLIYHLVLNFRLEPNEKTQIPLQLKKNPGGMTTEKGIHLQMKIR